MKCQYCGEYAKRVSGRAIYPKHPHLFDKQFLFCRPCDAWVGCHQNGEPFGILADAGLRKSRMKAHRHFDVIWKTGRMNRRNAYEWLANKLGIDVAKCHIGQFDNATCEKTVSFAIEFMGGDEW